MEMVSVNIAEVVENGRPSGNSVKKTQRKLRFSALEELWQDYSFQIVVVIISFVLLIYTVAGNNFNKHLKESIIRSVHFPYRCVTEDRGLA